MKKKKKHFHRHAHQVSSADISAQPALKKPYRIFAGSVEPEALAQFLSGMRQEFSVKGALMPDAHTGYTLPIGGVIATKHVILPSWVGYDIGCGICAYQTGISTGKIVPAIREIYKEIYLRIPTGFNRHKFPQNWKHSHLKKTSFLNSVFEKKGLFQLGTLGSGNHFIEIGEDEQHLIWIVVHSGSRGVGHAVATHYMKLAAGTGKASDGHFGFKDQSESGQDYINDMTFCLEYALENRKRMLEAVYQIIQECIRENPPPINDKQVINRNHNHAELHEGLWIHRKGATQAHAEMKGVVPGNMRDGSFIVEGMGNPESLWSCSHGAGRILSRNKAKRQLSLDDFKSTMSGIQAKVTQSTLDESPFAYKDIFKVMAHQEHMVKIHHHIKPVINIKA